jgi:hypothetical protein
MDAKVRFVLIVSWLLIIVHVVGLGWVIEGIRRLQVLVSPWVADVGRLVAGWVEVSLSMVEDLGRWLTGRLVELLAFGG